MANISQGQLRAMINQMVEQAVGEKMGARAASWQSDQRRIQAGLNYNEPKSKTYGDGFDFGRAGGFLRTTGNILTKFAADKDTGEVDYTKSTAKVGRAIAGAGAVLQGIGAFQDAYKNNDPFGGAIAGASALSAFGPWGALAGLGIGFVAGLFGKKKEINEWNKPKFKEAEQAYNKLFTVDRGERESYHMPESFYFRNGWSGARHIVVKVGNEQFNDHIRESMTSSYSNQLQRGLVF